MKIRDLLFIVFILIAGYYAYSTIEQPAGFPIRDYLEKEVAGLKMLQNVDLASLQKRKEMPDKDIVNIFSFRLNTPPPVSAKPELPPKDTMKRVVTKPVENSTVPRKEMRNFYSLIGFMKKEGRVYAFLSDREGAYVCTTGDVINDMHRVLSIQMEAPENSVTVEDIKSGQQFIIKLINR